MSTCKRVRLGLEFQRIFRGDSLNSRSSVEIKNRQRRNLELKMNSARKGRGLGSTNKSILGETYEAMEYATCWRCEDVIRSRCARIRRVATAASGVRARRPDPRGDSRIGASRRGLRRRRLDDRRSRHDGHDTDQRRYQTQRSEPSMAHLKPPFRLDRVPPFRKTPLRGPRDQIGLIIRLAPVGMNMPFPTWWFGRGSLSPRP